MLQFRFSFVLVKVWITKAYDYICLSHLGVFRGGAGFTGIHSSQDSGLKLV